MNSIEEQIREAIAAGKFSNLRGKGKPLPLEEDPYEDPDWRLAYHLLHENGYSLPWIETRREIEAELDACRQALRKAWQRRVSAPPRRRVERSPERLRRAGGNPQPAHPDVKLAGPEPQTPAPQDQPRPRARTAREVGQPE